MVTPLYFGGHGHLKIRPPFEFVLRGDLIQVPLYQEGKSMMQSFDPNNSSPENWYLQKKKMVTDFIYVYVTSLSKTISNYFWISR